MDATNTGAASISVALLGFEPAEVPGYRERAQCDAGVPPVLPLVTSETPMSHWRRLIREIVLGRSDVLQIDYKASFL